MNTITVQKQKAIAKYLKTVKLVSGLGTIDAPCSIAVINIILSGKLSDEIPECMSPAIGSWIIRIQDAMPDSLRNSERWHSLLPLAAGTGQDHETERAAALLDWMWTSVLPQLQPVADAKGFGAAWSAMCRNRTIDSAFAPSKAALAAPRSTHAFWGAAAATAAAAAAEAAASAPLTPEEVADRAAAAAVAALPDRAADYWTAIDPCGMLEKLINIGQKNNSENS